MNHFLRNATRLRPIIAIAYRVNKNAIVPPTKNSCELEGEDVGQSRSPSQDLNVAIALLGQ
jgi:hypothetical protein